MLQKCFTVDFLTKKRKVNEGEVPQYYVEHSHEAIIDPQEFELVQVEMARRERIGKSYSGNSIFSSRVICGDCGTFYGSKVWHSNNKYRREIWQCRCKFKNKNQCTTPHLTEDEIKERFLKAYAKLTSNREYLLEDCRYIQAMLTDTSKIDMQIRELLKRSDDLLEKAQESILTNSKIVQNQADYSKQYDEYIKQYEELKAQISDLQRCKAERELKSKAIGAFMFEINELSQLPIEFNEKLWIASIEDVTIHSDGRVVFRFKNGAEIET